MPPPSYPPSFPSSISLQAQLHGAQQRQELGLWDAVHWVAAGAGRRVTWGNRKV